MKRVLVLIIAILLFCSCTTKEKEVVTEKTDAINFKESYEALNNKENDGKKYKELFISEDNPFVKLETKDISSKLQSGDAIIYFGFPECPWCRNALPVLIDAANELGITEIYYNSDKDIRDVKELDEEGNIITAKEGTEEYNEIISILSDYLPVYKGLDNDEIKRLYFPTVVFVKDGNIIGLHTGTVDSQTDPYVDLTNEQIEELKHIYSKGINDVFEIVCDEAC